MAPEIGALLILRRASLLALRDTLSRANADDQIIACAISQELDGLPLALDQAGAYIKETPCPLPDYLYRYRTRRSDLLGVRGQFGQDYPASVATTWSLSFENVRQANPAATELLRFCSFLAPDAIPEHILTTGAACLGPVLAPVAADELRLDEAIRVLRGYSLIERNIDTAALIVHRLVQAVMRDALEDGQRRTWAERAVQTMRQAFPMPAVPTWPVCQSLLPHADICTEWIRQWDIKTVEAANLLHNASRYRN